jgi:nicotinamidase-related amidase
VNPGTDPSARLLDRKSVALLVIDLQAKLLPAIFESARVMRNCQLLLRLAQVLGLPTLLTTQYAKGLGTVVPGISSTIPELQPLDKTSFGCFGDSEFQRHLKNAAPQANTLLVAGIESHICVTQTVLGALEAGYLVHVAADATSSRTAENWQIGLKRMERAGAVISSTEMMVYELLARSDTAEFKAILPLIK